MAKENTFVDGMFVYKPHENAPKFIKLRVSIKVEEFKKFADAHKNGKGYINLDLKKSKEGKYYLTLNEWKKDGRDVIDDAIGNEINAQDIPF